MKDLKSENNICYIYFRCEKVNSVVQKKIVKPSKTISINNTEYYKCLELVCREHYKNKYARLFVNYTYVIDNINSKTMALIEPVENIKIVLPVDLLQKFKLQFKG